MAGWAEESATFPISLCRTTYILGSPAEEACLKRGNLIKEINRVEIHTA